MTRSVPQMFVRLQVGTGEQFRIVSDTVLSFEYTDSERKADKLKLTVSNHDLANFDDPAWRKGGTLIVGWGYEGNMTIARRVVIKKVTGFKILTIEALAESILMDTVSRCRAFDNATRSDVVEQIAEENGFGTDVRHIEATGERFEVINQPGVSDAQFLTSLAAREGFEFYVDFDGFHWHPRRLGSRPIRKITYFTSRTGDVLDGTSVKNDVTRRPGRVRVRARDPVTGEDIESVSDNDTDSERDTLSVVTETVVDPGTGDLTDVERQVSQEETRSSSQQTAGAIEAESRGRFRRTQQAAVRMRVPIVGDPQIYAKTVVELEGFGKRLSQRYWVKEAIHTLSTSGYRTDVVLVSDGHGGHSTDSIVATGLSLATGTSPQRRGGSGGSNSREAVEANLATLVRLAASSTEPRIKTAALQAQRAFAAQGFEAAAIIDTALVAITAFARATEADAIAEVAEATRAALIQGQGQETSTGGRPNTQSAPEGSETGPLRPQSFVDSETGELTTVFRPEGHGDENQ